MANVEKLGLELELRKTVEGWGRREGGSTVRGCPQVPPELPRAVLTINGRNRQVLASTKLLRNWKVHLASSRAYSCHSIDR